MIKMFILVHKCFGTITIGFATADWLAANYADNFKFRRGWNVTDFVSQIKKDHVIDVSRQKAYRARQVAETLVEGSIKELFVVLWEYSEEIKESNLGSTVKFKIAIDGNGKIEFKRLYIYYASCKEGFNNGYRKLVSLNRCHLKGPHK